MRLIANDSDDPAFIRAVTTPRRGIGQATLQVLGQFAVERHLSLFEAIFEIGDTGRLAAKQLEPLQTFGAFIQRFQDRAGKPRAAAAWQPAQGSLLTSMDEAAAMGRASGVDGAVVDSASLVLDDLLAAIQYERFLYDTLEERPAQTRWQNVLELVGWLKRKADEDDLTLLELVQHIALVTMLERSDDEEPNAVKLSTLHASKGLEYPHVFLIGVEEGLLPHLGRDEEDADPDSAAALLAQRIQEERRLMYVGITRAQRSLHLSWCKKRRRAREDQVREKSRFIDEMGLAQPDIAGEDPAMKALSPKDRLGMLKAMLNKS